MQPSVQLGPGAFACLIVACVILSLCSLGGQCDRVQSLGRTANPKQEANSRVQAKQQQQLELTATHNRNTVGVEQLGSDVAQTSDSDDAADFVDDPLTRFVLTNYLFLELHDRNLTSDERPALESGGSSSSSGGNGSSLAPASPPLGELASANRDLLSLGLGKSGVLIIDSGQQQQQQEASAANIVPTDRPFFGDLFAAIQAAYSPFHCTACLVICTIGIFANITNIVVLTR